MLIPFVLAMALMVRERPFEQLEQYELVTGEVPSDKICQSRESMPIRHHLEIGNTILGRFRLDYEIDSTSRASVYSALDLCDEMKVVIKVFQAQDEEQTNSVAHEIYQYNQLQDGPDSCLKLKESYKDRGNNNIYLVFEQFQSSLSSFSLQGQSQPSVYHNVKFIGREILKCIKYINNKGFQHNELSPSNVLVNFETDEGGNKIATEVGVFNFGQMQKTGGYIKSVNEYSAPEIAVTGKSSQSYDVWSFATLITEIYTGQQLFTSDDRLVLFNAMRFRTQQLVPQNFIDYSVIPNFSMFFTVRGTSDIWRHNSRYEPLPHWQSVIQGRFGYYSLLVHYLKQAFVLDPKKRIGAVSSLHQEIFRGDHFFT